MKNSRFGFSFLFLILIGVVAFSCSTASSSGFFESIAKKKLEKVPGLVKNRAPKLPSTELDWDKNAGDKFSLCNKIDTQEELDNELQKLRSQYAPFLSDLTPKIQKRERLLLDSFDWRYASENEGDAGAIAGDGEWTQVKIPHYAGPTGKVFSFYRKEIVLDNSLLSKERLFLHFQGVDYYADVFVNGEYVGFHEGLFDSFEFDIRPLVRAGKNTILVRVGNDGCAIGTTPIYGGQNFDVGPKMAASGGPGWDEPYKGWICTPVGYGLWQSVWLEARSDYFINDLFVAPHIDSNQAEVWVEIGGFNADLTRANFLERVGVEFSIYGQNFKAVVVKNRSVSPRFEDGDVQLFNSPQSREGMGQDYGVGLFKFIVDLKDYRLWDCETPWLYQLRVGLKSGEKSIDTFSRQFGMRSFVQSMESKPKGRFYLNGKEVRLRGANMMGNIMQSVIREDYDQLIDDILLAKIANMNFWRMTQQPCQPEAYDYFDRLGLMAQSDLPTFAYIPKTQGAETLREAGALMRMVRSHPSNIMISYINEPMEGAIRPQTRLSIGETASIFESCDKLISTINPLQVVKWVDGDYVNMSRGYSDHHCYNLWYWKHAIEFNRQYRGEWVSSRKGWMHGCGEFGVEGVDSLELMQKYYPKEWITNPITKKLDYKNIPCQAVRPSFERWIGKPKSLEEFISVSREHQRAATRLQMEAFRRDAKMNSTAIHLLIDAWPAGWLKTVMDYERKAKPAYFEFRDAQTPLAVNLRPDKFYGLSGESIKVGAWLCNDTPTSLSGASIRYQLVMDNKLVSTGSSPANIVASEPQFQGWINVKLPKVSKRTKLELQVALFNSEGELLHDKTIELEAFSSKTELKRANRPGGLWQFLIES